MQACKKAIDSTVMFLKKQKKPFKTRKIKKKKLIRLSKFTDLNYRSIKKYYKIQQFREESRLRVELSTCMPVYLYVLSHS